MLVLQWLPRVLLRAIPFEVGSGGGLEMSAGPFVAGETGFFYAGTQVGRVLACLLVIRTLGTPDLGRVLLQGFLWDLLPCSMNPLAGVAAWLGAGGVVGAFDGMVARALYFGGMVLRRTQNSPSGQRRRGRLARAKGDWLGSGRDVPDFKVAFRLSRGTLRRPLPE